jgi:hypothetical protein
MVVLADALAGFTLLVPGILMVVLADALAGFTMLVPGIHKVILADALVVGGGEGGVGSQCWSLNSFWLGCLFFVAHSPLGKGCRGPGNFLIFLLIDRTPVPSFLYTVV